MRYSARKGFSFGLTSGVITTLGLIVGLNSSTHSAIVVIGGILIIAIADAFSDALGIHISEESANKTTQKEVWRATIYTFLSKLIFASTFIIPVVLLPLNTAIIVSVIWGLFLISLFSYFMAKDQKVKPYKVVLEHLSIAVIVILLTQLVGELVRNYFGKL